MITLDVNLSADKVQETLDKVSEALTPESCAVVAAEAGADVVRDWFGSQHGHAIALTNASTSTYKPLTPSSARPPAVPHSSRSPIPA